MNRHFVACDLGEGQGRVMLCTLHNDHLTLSEVHRFEILCSKNKEGDLWDVAQLFQDVLTGLRAVGDYDEPVESISCSSWAADYLLFHADASFIPPTYHSSDSRTESGRKTILAEVPWAALYEETGVGDPGSTLFQLAAEKSRRLKRADHLMPVADGFNFLLSGTPWVEMSSASATQLYNPVTKAWSELLISVLQLPRKLLPSIVPGGTKLKPLRPEIAKATRLDNTYVVASCSNEYAAALFGLPLLDDEPWACLRLGEKAVLGTSLPEPVLSEQSRESQFTNTLGYGGVALFHKRTVGLWILEECRRYWAEQDEELNLEFVEHLAGSAAPFESFINLDDPRFATPGDMPLKIRAFCKETGQPEPRKPGAIIRCVLESLALHYRSVLDEMASYTGREFTRLYLLGDSSNSLLNHFIANALRIPVVVAPAHASAIGNVVAQALAMGHIPTVDHARRILRQSFKTETIASHPSVWSPAYDRFVQLSAAQSEATPA